MTGRETAEKAFDIAAMALVEGRDVDAATIAEIRAVVLKSSLHFGVVMAWISLLYSVEPDVREIFTVGTVTLDELLAVLEEVKH